MPTNNGILRTPSLATLVVVQDSLLCLKRKQEHSLEGRQTFRKEDSR